jgi:hypothetical protein
MILEAVRNHYLRLFGEPSREAHFKRADASVDILKWDADRHPQGVAFYATIGRSARPLHSDGPAHRVELFTGLLPAVDAIAFPLAELAISLNAMAPGSTFQWSEALWSGTAMNSFLVWRPVEEIVPRLDAAGLHVLFDQAIPLFPAERDFVEQQGAEALRERWRASHVPFWNPARSEG